MLRYIIAAFALAFALPAHHAAADGHVREYVMPFVPGAARIAYRNTFIVVTNMENQSALIDIKAHVNRSATSVSCGELEDLAPYEIRQFARNGGTLCVAADEPEDVSLRIRTVDGVHVTGYIVLSEARGNGFVPVDIIPTEPAGPEGITFSTLTLQGLTDGNHRLSVALRSSSRTWPYHMVACLHVRHTNPQYTGLYDDARRNCSLSNERVRGWQYPWAPQIIPIVTETGSATSEITRQDYAGDVSYRSPITYRVCISREPDDGLLPPPFLCKEVTLGAAAAQQDESAAEGD